MKVRQVPNILLISDTHFGDFWGLCPPPDILKIKLDNGGFYHPSKGQEETWQMWCWFCKKIVPMWCRGEPYYLVHNGDLIDNSHHNNISMITGNINIQRDIAVAVLAPLVDKSAGYLQIRGTQAHSGQEGQDEESIAKQLGSIKDELGNHSRYELWMDFFGSFIHFTHHISTTNSAAYESTQPMKELIESYTDCGRWQNRPPDVVCRSHRHSALEIRIPSHNTYATSLCTGGWQLKTPYVYRGMKGRNSIVHIGGHLIRHGDEDLVFTRFQYWGAKRTEVFKA